MKNSLLKSIRFNMDDESDRLLYEWLSHLPRGEFSSHSKQYWIEQMMRNEKEENDWTIEKESDGK